MTVGGSPLQRIADLLDGGDVGGSPIQRIENAIAAASGSSTVAISALPAVVTPVGTDEFPVNQAGQTKKMTLAQITSAIYPPSQKSFARTLLDLKPDRYWMLGEPSGTVCRDQTKANDGTYTGPPTLGQPGLLLGGDSGTAALFTAASSHKVDLTGNGINLTTGSPAFTFLAMLNPSSVTGNRFIFGAEAGGYEMDMVGARLNLRCTGVSDAGVSKSNITINTTHLVGGDYTPGGIQAIHYWLDGVDDTDPARTTWAGGAPGFTPGAKVTWLGVDPTVGAYWSGLKQHCAIWKRALTAGEWATLWAATGR